MMIKLIDLIKREPARVFAIFKAAIILGIAFGLHMTQRQQDALFGLAALVLGSGEATRAMVTPTAKLPGPKSAEEPPQ